MGVRFSCPEFLERNPYMEPATGPRLSDAEFFQKVDVTRPGL